MLEISFDEPFKRAYKKRIKGNTSLEQKFRTKIEIFRDNPFDSRLKTHKLSGKLKDLSLFCQIPNQLLINKKIIP